MQFLIRYNKRIYFLLGAIYDLSKYTRVFLSKDMMWVLKHLERVQSNSSRRSNEITLLRNT